MYALIYVSIGSNLKRGETLIQSTYITLLISDRDAEMVGFIYLGGGKL